MTKRKDNVDLICDIAELAQLFEKSRGLDNFLHTVVNTVAWHMKAAVCSIYLYDEERQELELRANQGLSPDAVGNIRLSLDEGLAGKALRELRPILEGRGSDHPSFKHIPEIDEERYQAFLAVPILRGLDRLGVLIVQDIQPDYFNDHDAKALKAIAVQLATTIENAELLRLVHQPRQEIDRDDERPVVDEKPSLIKGRAASPGIAIGRVVVMDTVANKLFADDVGGVPQGSAEDFAQVLKRVEKELRHLQQELEKEHTDIASMIFSAHLLMLQDDAFSGAMMRVIENGASVPEAVRRVVSEYVAIFDESSNPRLREKVHDVLDLGHRLIQKIVVSDDDQAHYADHVVVTRELLPSELLRLSAQRVEGIVMIGGGVSAHISILARSLRIPMVHVGEHINPDAWVGKQVVVDASHGTVFLQPDDEILTRFRNTIETLKEAEQSAPKVDPETYTRDGRRIHLLANVNLLSDIKAVQDLKAEGIGLYRSEFPFIVRDNFPSEEEQYWIYRTLLERLEGKEVTFRTLDVGGDKMLSYFPNVNEANPFLGLRAIRFSLQNREVFGQQLRAMLRAGADHDLKIMFPLVSSLDDFVQAREVVHECMDELREEGESFCAAPKLGVTVELPSVVEVINELAVEADFLSIGSNDLIQYLLGVDRTNEQISHMYMTHHPAVLRSLQRIVDAAHRNQVECSICGELAGDPEMAPFLVGIGLDRFSIEPRNIPLIQQRIKRLDVYSCRKVAERMLACGRITEVKSVLNEVNPDRHPSTEA